MSTRFARGEFERRWTALQGRMEAAGQNALLLTTAADVFYVTGFLTRFWESPTRPWFVVLPATGAPVAVIPSIGEALMRRSHVGEIRCWAAPDPSDDGVSLLADTLAEAVPGKGVIGLPMGHETHLRMPLADFERLRRRIAPRRFEDATATLQRVREVKSPAEVAQIREICGIAGRAFDRVPKFARAGVPLDEVFRRFQMACLDEGADAVPYLAGAAGPGGYTDVISPASGRALETGDVLMLDTGAQQAGYFCDFDRNWSVGPADATTGEAHRLLWEATEAGHAAARPGAMAEDVWRAMHAVIARGGSAGAGGRLGHGLGLQLTEWPSLMEGDRTPLVEGMVLTLEPALEIAPGRMLVHEENVVLRSNGAELLSPRAPVDLPVLG